MKKHYLLAGLIWLSITSFSQTKTNEKSYGWDNTINNELPDAIVMEEVDYMALRAEDEINDKDKSQPWRFGYKHDTNISLENAGEWTAVEGGNVWRLVINCPNAVSVNLMLENVNLPVGANLFLYDLEKTNKIGAYTSKNNRMDGLLGTELIIGETIVVEYFEPDFSSGKGQFTIANVIHGYRSLDPIQEDLSRSLNDSGDCNIDVNCPLGDDFQEPIRSVAMIVVGGNGICSGALINNTCEDGKPLFLTADHCLDPSLGGWAFRFNWQSPEGAESCATSIGSVDPGSPYDQTANGATLLANSTGSDFALLEIDNMTAEDALAWNCYYAGWDRSDATTVTEATGIHHPRGDVKKICREDNAPFHSFSSGAEVWWISDWEQGVTEGGSSGSPLFDQNQRIIGQLYGGSAACSGTIDNGGYDFYGRLGVSWELGASAYLAPTVCGDAPLTLDGFDPSNVCTGTVNAEITNVLCNGAANGTVSFSISDGDGPFTFELDGSSNTDGNFTDLEVDTYSFSITNNVGCIENGIITINEPANTNILFSSSLENAGGDGSINTTILGGVAPFTYSWTGPSGFTSTEADPSELIAGIYTVTVLDANGCVTTRDNIVVDSGLSLNEDEFGIKIYPNPSQGQFLIQNDGANITNLTVFDFSGRIVLEESTLSNNHILDLTNKANGTYLIQISTGNSVYTKKIVKR